MLLLCVTDITSYFFFFFDQQRIKLIKMGYFRGVPARLQIMFTDKEDDIYLYGTSSLPKKTTIHGP